MANRILKHVLRAEEGATAVEFALIAPVLVLFTLGIIETAMMMLAQNLMEGATFAASRVGKTGFVEAGMTREETIINELNNKAGALLDSSLVHIESLAYNQFGDVGNPEPFVDANGNGTRDNGENYTDVNANGHYDTDMGASGQGNAGQVVVYTVTYPWHVSTPIMNTIIGNDQGVFELTARTVVKNEPF